MARIGPDLKRAARGQRLKRRALAVLLLVSLLAGWLPASAGPASAPTQAAPGLNRARSIILFIGDGMGAEQRKAARWQADGLSGALVMDQLPYAGWSQTASANSSITDSAAGATALATGVKTNNGYIAVDPDGTPLETILEQAQQRGLAAGLITTVQISHATPAAFAAHVLDRNQMTEIARQLLEQGVEVLLGGGEDEFQPTTTTGCFSQPGLRTDGRDLTLEAQAAGYAYLCDPADLALLDPASTPRLLGLFADGEMSRPYAPSLAAMTQTAIDILDQDPDGFFLMVEGGRIDKAAHANDAENTIADVLGLDAAVQVGLDYAALHPDTLVLVAADHETGGMLASLTPTGEGGEDGPFFMPDSTPFYVRWTTTGHTGVDIPVTASGPRADWVAGTFSNTYLYEIMDGALDWWLWLPFIAR